MFLEHYSPQRILLKCKFWFSMSGRGPNVPSFCCPQSSKALGCVWRKVGFFHASWSFPHQSDFRCFSSICSRFGRWLQLLRIFALVPSLTQIWKHPGLDIHLGDSCWSPCRFWELKVRKMSDVNFRSVNTCSIFIEGIWGTGKSEIFPVSATIISVQN